MTAALRPGVSNGGELAPAPSGTAGTPMSVESLIGRTATTLRGVFLLRALLIGACATIVTLIVLQTAGRLVAASATGVGSSMWGMESILLRATIATLVGLVTALIARTRVGQVDAVRAALWMEERAPVGYALVTLAEGLSTRDPRVAMDRATLSQLERAVDVRLDRNEIGRAMRRLATRQATGPMLFATIAVGVLIAGAVARRGGVVLGRLESAAASSPQSRDAVPIGAWRVRIVPPAYTGASPVDAGDVGSVRALAGSRVEIRGPGDVPRVEARTAGDSGKSIAVRTVDASTGDDERAGATPGSPSERLAAASGGSWVAVFTTSAQPIELRATRGGATKLLLVDSYSDSIPRVRLQRPARDSVFRSATGTLPLVAELHDDLGVASGGFDLIVSSGEGERFTARTTTVGATRYARAKDVTLRATLDLAAMGLQAGDVIHLRASARDAAPGAPREAGVSETRSFRIARASEYDSVAVEPAPPPAVDTSMISQRMLLMLTEKLEKRRPTLQRPLLVGESRRIANDQSRLRQSVGNVVFQRLTGEETGEHTHTADDGHNHGVDLVNGKLALPGRDPGATLEEGNDSPVIAINQPLLEAYNAMWDAQRALEVADTKAAIPHMRLALAAIERARAASRLYLRGKPSFLIVDVNKVRLTGKDTGQSNERSARAELPAKDVARERRLLAAASLLSTDRDAGRDSLAMLRLESVGEAPSFAEALTAALEAIGAGREPTDALVRARRSLGGVTRLAPSGWSRGSVP